MFQGEAGPVNARVAMKKHAIAISLLAILAVLVLAVLRAWASRELILETNGLPLANLNGGILPSMPTSAGSGIVPTSTDRDGRLDLRGVPRGTTQINVELRDGAGNVRLPNTFLQFPTNGCRMVVDFRGSRTIRTTTTTYADFILFKLTTQEVLTWDQRALSR